MNPPIQQARNCSVTASHDRHADREPRITEQKSDKKTMWMASSSRFLGIALRSHLAPPAAVMGAATNPFVATVGISTTHLLGDGSRRMSSSGVAAEQRDITSSGGSKNSHWVPSPPKVVREDGTEWKWSCFRPWDSYSANLSIDLHKHHVPASALDKIALRTIKAIRIPVDMFFQKRYGCRAMMLETVAAVPGMVAGLFLHLRSLRRFEHSGGWIKALLEEAENERMHLMAFMEVSEPKWYERALVITVQGIFFNVYLAAYVLSPKLAHRVVGYLEEEAVHSYTEFLKELDTGRIENVPAPAIAIDYWRLGPDATLRDVVLSVRADEAHHRDVNHFASDLYFQGMQLRESPAPLDYH